MSNSLIKKTGLYLIGNLSAKLVSFFLIPLYAFYVNPEDLGNYDYSQTVMLILVPFIFMAIWEAILKFLLKNEDKKDEIISSTIIFVTIISFIFIIIYCIFKSKILLYFENLDLIVIMILSYSLACIWQYYARGLKENNAYVLGSICGTLINFIMNVILLCLFKFGIVSLYISYIISQVSIFIILEHNLKCIKKVKLKYFNFSLLKEMISFSAPLVLNLISMWFISGFGRTLISRELGPEIQGLYAFANKFGVVINVLGSVISMALIEESVMKSKENDLQDYFSKTIQKLFIMFQSIIVFAVPIISIFYKFIKNTQYYASINIFGYFLLYAMFMTMATNVGAIFQAIDKTKYIFITTVAGAIVTIIFSSILISSLGIIGVAIGQILGAISMLISRYIISNYYLKLKININKIFILLIIYIISIIIAINSNIIVNILLLTINIGIIYTLNKNDIKKILIYIKKIINKKRIK